MTTGGAVTPGIRWWVYAADNLLGVYDTQADAMALRQAVVAANPDWVDDVFVAPAPDIAAHPPITPLPSPFSGCVAGQDSPPEPAANRPDAEDA